jgi:hypothetical protein
MHARLLRTGHDEARSKWSLDNGKIKTIDMGDCEIVWSSCVGVVTDGSLSQSCAVVDAGTEGDWYIWNGLDVLHRKVQL